MIVYAIIAGVIVFLTGISFWAFHVTASISDVSLGQGGIAIALWALAAAGLIVGFLWLSHRQRRTPPDHRR